MNEEMYLELKDKILSRTSTHGDDAVFTDHDVCDLANEVVVVDVLNQMAKNGVINKLLNEENIYMRNLPSEIFDEAKYAPRIAEALSRKYGYMIIPTGEFALTVAGLRNSKKCKPTFITSGEDKVLEGKDIQITLIHKEFPVQGNLSYQSEFILQIFTALGNDKITDSIIEHLKKEFTHSVLKSAAYEIKNAPGTPSSVKEIIRKSTYGKESTRSAK